MSTRYLVDTNVLLRFLSGQPVKQAEAAKRLFEAAAAGTVSLARISHQFGNGGGMNRAKYVV